MGELSLRLSLTPWTKIEGRPWCEDAVTAGVVLLETPATKTLHAFADDVVPSCVDTCVVEL